MNGFNYILFLVFVWLIFDVLCDFILYIIDIFRNSSSNSNSIRCSNVELVYIVCILVYDVN